MSDQLKQARRWHQQKEWAKAAQVYQALIAEQKHVKEALYGLAVLAAQQQDYPQAQHYFATLIQSLPHPDDAIWKQLVLATRLNGDLAQALRYAQAWMQQSIAAQAAFETGVLAFEQDQSAIAQSAFESALQRGDSRPEIHYCLARLLAQNAERDQAEQHWSLALKQAPQNVGWQLDYADFLLDAPEAWPQAQLIFEQQTQGDDAWRAQTGLIEICLRQSQPLEALAQLEAVQNPPEVESLYLRARCFLALNQYEQAHRAIAQLLGQASDHSRARYLQAWLYLIEGDYLRGFEAYEARRQLTLTPRELPDWQGESLQGKSLIVYAEQGFGDTLQFARFLSKIKSSTQASAVYVSCQPELKSLLEQITGIDRCLSPGQTLPDRPDLQLPLMSLPHQLGVSLKTLPTKPYIAAAASNPISLTGLHKVGLVWASGKVGEQQRSLKVQQLAELLQAFPELELYSLQYQANKQGVSNLQALSHFEDLSPQIHDFADTANCIAQLDLLITVDTAIAHLAGAMGHPVWILLPFSADWRWLSQRSDSPWYPSARLFRQAAPGDWTRVLAQLKHSLKAWLGLRNTNGETRPTDPFTSGIQNAIDG